MDPLTKLNEFHKQDDELLLANINHELLSGAFGISRIQRYNQAAHLVDRSIENGILVRPDDYPHMIRSFYCDRATIKSTAESCRTSYKRCGRSLR
ncbi:hypothetical protein [Pseudoalteromonas ostreae]|uniref:hypothetical protein n=1 Tax=Pseudoalteromonas ostreae TaxID=2774154 RepID=UPI001B35A548|nr:hypothetical protein [Pseudoalteromonas ostreae]